LATLSSGFLGACTTISIDSGDGVVKVTRRAGFAYVELPPNTDSVVEMRGYGMSFSRLGGGIGFIQQRFAALNGDCRVVIWVDDLNHIEAVRAIAAEHPEICVAGKEIP